MQFERFSGTHFEMGRQHGRAFADHLHRCRNGFEAWSPATRPRYNMWLPETRQQVDSLVAKWESALSRLAPELIEEMRGIAEGAQLSYEDILRLNFAEELRIPTNCSQVGLSDGKGGAIMGKHEDAGFPCTRTYAITELRPERGYAQLHVGAVNWVVSSGSGINEAGLCLGQSSLRVTDQADGVPRLTLLRLALERCATVAEASAFLQNQNGAVSGMNFLMVDATGAMAVVEHSPTQRAVRRPENGAIWATNHAIDLQMRAVEQAFVGSEPTLENDLTFSANTRQRYGRVHDFAKDHAGQPVTKELLERIMWTHGPGGICQHGIMPTTWSVIMAPQSRELWLSDGPPCRYPYQHYTFNGQT